MTDATKLPPGEFVTADEAMEWAQATLESYLEACNAITHEQRGKVLAMLVSVCCAKVGDEFGGLDAIESMLDSVHARLAQAVAMAANESEANPGLVLVQ